MAESTSISNIASNNLQTQDYSVQDINLLNEYEINREFGAEQDIVEHHIYSATNNILYSNYNFQNYSTLITNPENSLYDTLYIDPEENLKTAGYTLGSYNVIYNFYRPLFLSSNTVRYFIKEISSDRTRSEERR